MLASGRIFEDMNSCGSEDKFRAKFCPRQRTETPKAKCLRYLAQVIRLTEDLEPEDMPEIDQRLGELRAAVGSLSPRTLHQPGATTEQPQIQDSE
jgi:hypothetical protein